MDLSFDFGRGVLTGTLQSPSDLGAVGGAGVLLRFVAKPIFGSAPTVTRVFEEVLTAGINLGTPVLPANWLRGMPLVNGLTYDWTLTMRVNAGAIPAIFANNAPPEAVSRSSFGNTYYWGGLEGVFDASGQPLSGVTLSTDSGFDLVTVSAVPEPGNWALWLGGLAVMGHLLRRRAASLT